MVEKKLVEDARLLLSEDGDLSLGVRSAEEWVRVRLPGDVGRPQEKMSCALRAALAQLRQDGWELPAWREKELLGQLRDHYELTARWWKEPPDWS